MRRFAALLALAAAGAATLASCGGDEKGARKGAPPAPPPAATKPPEPTVTVTHLLVASVESKLPGITRTKEQAKLFATEILSYLAAGNKFDDLVGKFSDDRDRTSGKPNTNNGTPGSYTFDRKYGMAKAFTDASFATPVGQITTQPVDTQFGYHIIRRDK